MHSKFASQSLRVVCAWYETGMGTQVPSFLFVSAGGNSGIYYFSLGQGTLQPNQGNRPLGLKVQDAFV